MYFYVKYNIIHVSLPTCSACLLKFGISPNSPIFCNNFALCEFIPPTWYQTNKFIKSTKFKEIKCFILHIIIEYRIQIEKKKQSTVHVEVQLKLDWI